MVIQNTFNTPASQAAQVIWAHWQAGQVLQALPAECRPLTTAQGYAAQAQLPGVSGRTVVGWKIAATSANGQSHINVSGPLAGRLLSGHVFKSGDTVPSADNRMRVAKLNGLVCGVRSCPMVKANSGSATRMRLSAEGTVSPLLNT